MPDPNDSNTIKPAFRNSAKVTDSTRIKIQLIQTEDKHRLLEYEDLMRDHERLREGKIKRQEEGRLALTHALAQKNLNETINKLHPELKPSHLSHNDLKIKERAAYVQAKQQVSEIERSSLEKMDQNNLREQRDILKRAKSNQARQEFNQSKNEGLTQSFQQSSQKGGISL